MKGMAELKQPVLFDAESDEALFLNLPGLQKRYTAEQVKNLDYKRNAIVLLVASGVPTEKIAAALGVGTRTVNALAAAEAQKVAGERKEFGRMLHGLGARWFGLARQKEEGAKFLDLVMAAGIATQRGNEVLLTGEVAGEKVLEMEGAGSEVRDRVLRAIGLAPGSDKASSGGVVEVVAVERNAEEEERVGAGLGAGDAGGQAADPAGVPGGGGGLGGRPVGFVRLVNWSGAFLRKRQGCLPRRGVSMCPPPPQTRWGGRRGRVAPAQKKAAHSHERLDAHSLQRRGDAHAPVASCVAVEVAKKAQKRPHRSAVGQSPGCGVGFSVEWRFGDQKGKQ